MSPRPPEADFGIEISYERHSDAPARVFKTMTALIEAFEFVDRELVSSVARISPVLLLEDIESGSIKTWLRTKLESVDDQVLKSGDWKQAVGACLVKSKYIIIDFLRDKTTITTKAEMEGLQSRLLETARDSDVLGIPSYRPVPIERVAESVRRIGEATQNLKLSDKAKYMSDLGDVDFNLGFSVAPDSFEALITRESIVNQAVMILKVKKPDFLGESMWDFKFQGRTIEVLFRDFEWLKRFRERTVVLRPGDAIKGLVETEVRYSFEGEALSTRNTLIRVDEVISVENPSQSEFFES
jgi:hypothetical protein